MSSITSRLSGSSTLIFLPLYFIWRKKKKAVTIMLLVIVSFTISSCFLTFFNTNTKPKADSDLLQKLQLEQKVFIFHFKDSIVELKNIKIKNDALEADIIPLSKDHQEYLDPKINQPNRVKQIDKQIVFAEVHLYTNDMKYKTTKLVLPISSINRIDVYELNESATKTNHTLSIIGITVAGLIVIVAATTAVACNCPQVYINNNGQYQFNGGMYSGAVYTSLERTDYMPLGSLQPMDTVLKLTIGNVPDEEQFINSMQLLKVTHSTNAKVLVTRHGQILSFKKPESPIAAVLDEGSNVNDALLKVDQNYYQFNNRPANNNFSNVILTFKKPVATKKAKLIINGKNSNWSGYIYNEFSGLFGAGIYNWRKKLDNADPKVTEQWQKDQALPIMVYIKNGTDWKYTDYFSLVGNTASRDMIMEIDLGDIKEETVQIKLETVYHFWDLDYAALDFSENEIQSSLYLNPVKAEKTDSTNEIKNLFANDDQYTHLKGSEAVSLQFEQPVIDKNTACSYFLVGNGYYHSMKKYEGKTKTLELLEFKNKGAFNAFSKSKYNDINNELAKYAVNKYDMKGLPQDKK